MVNGPSSGGASQEWERNEVRKKQMLNDSFKSVSKEKLHEWDDRRKDV